MTFESAAGRMMRVFILLFWCSAATFTTSHAQDLSSYEASRFSGASYYNYSEPADVTILVNVWGTVRNPGLYEIPEGTTLSHLLSLTGGPIVSQRQRRHDRTIQIRVFRREGSARSTVVSTEMRNEVAAMSEDTMVVDGDVVTIETVVQQRFGWRDAFSVVAAVASVTLAIERIFR